MWTVPMSVVRSRQQLVARTRLSGAQSGGWVHQGAQQVKAAEAHGVSCFCQNMSVFGGVKGWGGCYRHHSARTNSRKLQGGVSFQEGLLFVCPAIFACAQWSGTRHRHAAEHSIRPVRMNRCIILHCMLKALAMDDDDRAS